MAELTIRNEEEAYEALIKLSKGQLKIGRDELSFKGWPKLRIHLTGDQYDQSITPTVMKGFVELQRSLLRSYAITKYNTPSVRVLSRAERKELEIEVKVSGGSSGFEINFQQMLMKMVELVGAKMEPVHVVTMVLGIAVLYFGKDAFKVYLENRRQEREREAKTEETRALVEQMKFAGAEETKRVDRITQMAENNAQLLNIARGAYDARTALVRSFETADEAKIQGIALDGEVAHELTRNARRQSEEVRLDGTYRILRVDSSDPAGFKMRVINVDNRQKIEAVVQESVLTADVRKLLQSAEWERKNIGLQINAKELGDTLVEAKVLKVIPGKD